MIVVDTNILAYLYLPTKYTDQAEQLLQQEPVWAAPYLWRSEFRNVLALYIRKDLISFAQALKIQQSAEGLMRGNEYQVNSLEVLSVVDGSSCSAYDAEYIALAKSLKALLVTQDKKVLREFPKVSSDLSGTFG